MLPSAAYWMGLSFRERLSRMRTSRESWRVAVRIIHTSGGYRFDQKKRPVFAEVA
jgi:hypothetical protein